MSNPASNSKTCFKEPEFVDFNVNNYVLIKLTDFGRKAYQKYYREQGLLHFFKEREEDEEGWSKWQMHELFDIFGKYFYIGQEIPFELNIRIKKS